MSTRIGYLVKLNGSTLIALRGIIAVHRDVDALDSEGTEVILEGGVKILVGSEEGVFVRREWENWAVHEMAKGSQ